jgi:hypothetical protein
MRRGGEGAEEDSGGPWESSVITQSEGSRSGTLLIGCTTPQTARRDDALCAGAGWPNTA